MYVCAADASDGDAGANPEQDVSHLQLSFPAVTVVVPSSDARTLDQKHLVRLTRGGKQACIRLMPRDLRPSERQATLVPPDILLEGSDAAAADSTLPCSPVFSSAKI